MSPRVPALELSLTGLRADGAALEIVARLGLLARRLDLELVFSGASPELTALIELAGLGHLLGS